MKVLVTGGAGFLGSHLCDALIIRGHTVVCIDNLSTGSVRNVAHLAGLPAFKFIEADVTHGIDLPGPFRAVAHLASPASPLQYLRQPLQTLAAGSKGTEAALKIALRDAARFVLASTSEVYGEPLVHPQREDYWGNVNPVGPRSVYDEAKRFAEALTTAYRATHGVDTGIVRIFNTYGPQMSAEDGRVVINLLSQAMANKPLTIYGDGSQTRSFCYITDLVRGLMAMIDSAEPGPINLGNPVELTISDLANLILRAADSASIIEYRPLPPDDPTRRRPDITRATRLLSWEPQVEIEAGLRLTAEWLRSEPPERATLV